MAPKWPPGNQNEHSLNSLLHLPPFRRSVVLRKPLNTKREQQMDKDENNFKVTRYPAVFGFLRGSSLFIICSIVQKTVAGFNPFILEAYTVPFLLGGITGAILATKCAKIKELNNALRSQINDLESFLPICSHCKKIREPEKNPKDRDSWQAIEHYISERTSSMFSHGICPDCLETQYPEFTAGKRPWSDLKEMGSC